MSGMPKFYIKERCTTYAEAEVEADDEDAAWDAYYDPDRTFDVMSVSAEYSEATGEIREGDGFAKWNTEGDEA